MGWWVVICIKPTPSIHLKSTISWTCQFNTSHGLRPMGSHSPHPKTISNWASKFDCRIEWNMPWQIITARKRSLWRLCFYTCLSVHRKGRPGQVPPQAGTPPWAGTPPGWVHPPGRYTPLGRYTPGACWEIRATSGQYASYWNAFLFTFPTAPTYNTHHPCVHLLSLISLSIHLL